MIKFGRVPGETIDLFQKTIQQVNSEIITALPGSANDAVRSYTVEQLLEIVFRDWRENENTAGLEPADMRDLSSFVAMAASLAGSDLNGQGFPVYQAVLKGLLEDWLYNWNAPDDPGPPGPIN
jgi:hypothetical protein